MLKYDNLATNPWITTFNCRDAHNINYVSTSIDVGLKIASTKSNTKKII